jgi:hypothetical protein
MKFTIRDLFLVTVIVALVVALLVDRYQLSALKKQLDNACEKEARWEEMAKTFATMMRHDGWYVRIDADGGGNSVTPRSKIDPKVAAKLNDENPLPTSSAPAPTPAKP